MPPRPREQPADHHIGSPPEMSSSCRLNDELFRHEPQRVLPDESLQLILVALPLLALICQDSVSTFLHDKVQKTAEVVDKVAAEEQKIADEVAETAFQGNEMIKEAASKIKAVAEEIEEDADRAEALIEKLSYLTTQ